MSTSGFRFLRPEDMRRVSSYEFAPKALVEGYFSGRHRSLEKGSSTEFRDYRQYVEGDDPSRIDWRVFARSDRHYVRNFHQETSMNCYIMLDCSASMGFGQGTTKLEYSSFFAAALAYLVVRSKDRVGLCTFDQKIRNYLPLGSTGKHLEQILTTLERNTPGSETSLAAVLKQACPLAKQRGSIIIISDFLDDPSALFEAFNLYIHRGFRIYLYQILAPEELALEDRGLVAYEDLETRERIIAHSREIAKPYEEAMANHIRALRTLARRRQIHHQLARTDTHFFNLFDALVDRPR